MTNWNQLHQNHFQGLKTIVTGGAGFIGSHITYTLAQLGSEVTVIDDLSGGKEENLQCSMQGNLAGKVRFVKTSILDRKMLDEVFQGVRYVFHQGALPSVPRSIEHPELYQEVNTNGTLQVLQAARKAKVARVMFAASSSAYGDTPTLPKIEDMPGLPKSPYAANKLACEHLMRAWASSYDIDTVSLRYFNIFGPRQNPNSAYAGVIAAFARMLNDDEPLTIDGDGEQSRDFTFVDNAVHANLLAASHATPLDGEVMNVGCGLRITINQLAEAMAKLWHKSFTPTYRSSRAGDVMHSLADLQRIRTTLGYDPIVDFETGLKKTVQWYQAALAKV